MTKINVETSMGIIIVSVHNDEAYVKLSDIAHLKSIDVQDIEAAIVEAANHDPLENVEYQQIEALKRSLIEEFEPLGETIKAKSKQLTELKKEVKKITDEAEIVNASATISNLKTVLADAEKQHSALGSRIAGLEENLKNYTVFSGVLQLDALVQILV